MCSQKNNDQEKRESKLSGRQQVRRKQNSGAPVKELYTMLEEARYPVRSKISRIRKEKINKRN